MAGPNPIPLQVNTPKNTCQANAYMNNSSGTAICKPPKYNNGLTQAPPQTVKAKTPQAAPPDPKSSALEQIKHVYESSFMMHQSKEKAYDDLAEFIATNTIPRRLKNNANIILPTKIKLNGQQDVMEYLHKIGYWKDKPRRLKKAAEIWYDKFSAEKDPQGKRTKGYSENAPNVTPHIEELTGMARAFTKEQRNEENKLLKTKDEDKHLVHTTGDKISQKIIDDQFSWSALTISKFHHMAGSGDTFKYSEGHVTYAKHSKRNTNKNNIDGIEKLHRAFDSPELIKDRTKLAKLEKQLEKIKNEIKTAKSEGKAKKLKKLETDLTKLEKKLQKRKDRLAKYGDKDKATPVQMGDTLHRGRGEKGSSYKIIRSFTHSDVVVNIAVFKGNNNNYTKVGDYEQLKKEFDNRPMNEQAMDLSEFAQSRNYSIFAETIGGNTLDFKKPGEKMPQSGTGQTLGKNFIPLNADKTIKEETGRNGAEYVESEAYYGIQRTDY